MNRKNKLIALLNVFIILTAVFIFASTPRVERDVSGVRTHPTSVVLHVETRDAEGNLISEVWKENDLYLWNYANITASDFAGFTNCFTVKDDVGDTYWVHGSGSTGTSFWYSLGAGDCVLQVGNDTTTPTINDYRMGSSGTWFDEESASAPSVGWSGNLANISISSTFSYVNPQNVSEAGLGFKDFTRFTSESNCESGTSHAIDSDTVLILHDVFSNQEIGAGGDITITYILRFNQ